MQQMNINFDTGYVERLINELKSNTELLEADRETEQERLNKITHSLALAESKLIYKKTDLEKDTKTLAQYTKLYRKFYQEKNKNKEPDPRM